MAIALLRAMYGFFDVYLMPGARPRAALPQADARIQLLAFPRNRADCHAVVAVGRYHA